MRGRVNEPIIPIPDPLGGRADDERSANRAPDPVDEAPDVVDEGRRAVEDVPNPTEEAPDAPQEPESSQAGAATVHRPPYRAGPSGGDNHTVTKNNPQAGTVMVLEHNTRQAAFVHCIGNGPMSMLRVEHPVTKPVSSVKIDYSSAVLTDSVVMNAVVTGSSSGWLGQGASLGPKEAPGDWAGTIDIPLDRSPEAGETLMIQFGLQTHAGCLPYPVLGLPGSRPAESGRAAFPQVSVS